MSSNKRFGIQFLPTPKIWCFDLRGVHGSSWIKFRRFFNPTYHGLEKIQPNSTHHRGSNQPNPHGSSWVGLDPWVAQFIFIIIIIIIIIINLRKKYIFYLPPELINKIYMN